MFNVEIMFKSIEDMTEFINIMNKVDANVDIKNGSIEFDAKSAEGIYTLPINKKLVCSTHDSCAEQLRAAVEKFIV